MPPVTDSIFSPSTFEQQPPLKASYYADGTAPLTTLACLTLQRLTN
jgi:hypothetical protein